MPPQQSPNLTPDKVLSDPNWQGLPREERRKVLQQVDPAGYGKMEESEQWNVVDQAVPQTSSMAKAGFWESLRSTTPFAKSDMPDFSQMSDEELQQFRRPPTIIEQGQQRLEAAGAAAKAGDVPGAIKNVAAGAFGPIGGEAVAQAGEQFGAGNISGGLGTTVGLIAPFILAEGGARFSGWRSARLKAPRLASAFGASPMGTVQTLQRVGSEIEAAAKATGKPLHQLTVEDLVGRPTATSTQIPTGVLADASKALEDEFQQDFASIKNNRVYTPVIRNRILKYIRNNSHLQNTEEGRAQIDALLRTMHEYDVTGWTLEEFNKERSRLNTQLRGLRGSRPSDVAAALKLDADMKAKQIVADTMGDVVNDWTANASGKPVDHYHILRQKQADLIDLRDYLEDHFTRIQDVSAARKGAPVSQRVRPHVTVGKWGPRAHVGAPISEGGGLAAADTSLQKAYGGSRRQAIWRATGVGSIPIAQLISQYQRRGMTPPPGEDQGE